MKKIIVLIFFTFSFVIYSQEIDDRNKKETVLDSDSSKANPNLTQSEIRMSKKMETSFGLASDTDNLYVVKIRYNFTPNFSIGYSHFHRKDILKNQEFLVFQLPSTDSYGLHNKSIDKSRELGLLNVRYYFFDKFPLYATGGIGRDFIGIRTQEYLHSTYYNSFFSYGQINIDTKPNYNYSLGIGFQWNFETGFFLGFEFLKLSPLNQKKAASGITKASSPNDTTFDIRQYFLLSSIGMLSSQEYGSRIRIKNSRFLDRLFILLMKKILLILLLSSPILPTELILKSGDAFICDVVEDNDRIIKIKFKTTFYE